MSSFARARQALDNEIKAVTDMRRQYAVCDVKTNDENECKIELRHDLDDALVTVVKFKIQEVEEEFLFTFTPLKFTTSTMSTTQPNPNPNRAYIILRTNYQRLPNHSRGYTYTSEDPIVLSAHATNELASEALIDHKRFITYNANGDYMTRDYALYMCRDMIDGVDIILTPRSHIPPTEVRLRVQVVDVKEDEKENKKLDEAVRRALNRNRVEFGRGPMELRQVRTTWRGPGNEGQEDHNAESDGEFYSDLEIESGREVPRRFRGHSIDGSVRTLKWNIGT
ncbi:hypothetical protein FB567DRAFT_589891 [Paraphoma chrysanthemicola]|uniref:Uncharacterized protein n=1 Tax=Paraphoma chrysanthemicola TaxID=798071 RepID=A0A8K0RCS9_9PLEO|nr:hypothetical protein FB567DRAFT_589891 [Paraphoma chrysanthemicola]